MSYYCNMVFKRVEFSTAIKTKRHELGIGLREAGEQAGINYATLSRLENEHMPDLLTYQKVCEWLDTNMHIFFKKN